MSSIIMARKHRGVYKAQLVQDIVNQFGNMIDWTNCAEVETAIVEYLQWEIYPFEVITELRLACAEIAPVGQKWENTHLIAPMQFEFRLEDGYVKPQRPWANDYFPPDGESDEENDKNEVLVVEIENLRIGSIWYYRPDEIQIAIGIYFKTVPYDRLFYVVGCEAIKQPFLMKIFSENDVDRLVVAVREAMEWACQKVVVTTREQKQLMALVGERMLNLFALSIQNIVMDRIPRLNKVKAVRQQKSDLGEKL